MSSKVASAEIHAKPVAAAPAAAAVLPLRTLLVDCYDSYSYNLYAALTASNAGTGAGAGSGHTVVCYSDSDWDGVVAPLIASCDNIVLSPGPGTPERDTDFGVCRRILQTVHDKPIFGVCLGLQGIVTTFGGRVTHARHGPMHGRLSAIAYDSATGAAPLFAPADASAAAAGSDDPSRAGAVPQNFRVVRYNSLLAELPLPECLKLTAWTKPVASEAAVTTTAGSADSKADSDSGASSGADAIEVMGLDHRTRPIVSVQFHPESICSEFGARLFANFAHFTRRWYAAEPNKRILAAARIPQTFTPPPPPPAHAQSRCGSDSVQYQLLCESVPYGDSESAFVHLFGKSVNSFWLDSSRVEKGLSRFSIMGDSSGPHSLVVSYCVASRTLTTYAAPPHAASKPKSAVDQKQSPTPSTARVATDRTLDSGETFLRVVESLLTARRPHAPIAGAALPAECGFQNGLIGYFGYEMKSETQSASKHPFVISRTPSLATAATTSSVKPKAGTGSAPGSDRVPDACFLFADRSIIFDHQTQTCYLLCLCLSPSTGATAAATADIASAKAWLQSTKQSLAAVPKLPELPAFAAPAAAAADAKAPQPASSSGVQFRFRHNKTAYLSAIRECQKQIRDGESYELCLTNQLFVSDSDPTRLGIEIDPLLLHRHLRRINPAPYAAFLRFDEFTSAAAPASGSAAASNFNRVSSFSVVCSSPERFVRVDSAGVIESKPIKGTRPRGATPAADAEAIRSLSTSEKDFAENLMIVDLIRNDLNRVCVSGSVHVPSLMAVETYATVHQLVTTVRGQLPTATAAAAGSQLLSIGATCNAVRMAFPPGSMTGAPKLRSTQILHQLESAHDATHAADDGSRGVYSGCLGYLSLNGATDLNVVIRTAVCVRKSQPLATAVSAATATAVSETARSGGCARYSIRIGTGGAIVFLSDPAEEYDEIQLKARALKRAIRLTLGVDPNVPNDES